MARRVARCRYQSIEFEGLDGLIVPPEMARKLGTEDIGDRVERAAHRAQIGPGGINRGDQSDKRRIGEDGFFQPKRKTLMYNGYGDLVASMYQGMDLRKNF